MLEELAISIIFGIIGHSSGIASEIGVHKFVQFIKNNRGQKKFINHDLKRGLYHAYLLALMNLCNECLAQEKRSQIDDKETNVWLETKKQQLAGELYSNEKENANGNLELSLKEIETLLSSTDLSDSEYIKAVKDKLIEFSLLGESVPPCYEKKVRESFFEELSLYFAFEIKDNDRLRHIFENQILSHIDIRIDTLEKSIEEISKKHPELQNKLDIIHTELIGTRTQLDSHHEEILSILTSNGDNISEIKSHMRILNYHLMEDMPGPDADSDFTAILFIKKDDVPTKKKIHLTSKKKNFIIGRKIRDANPDIPLGSSFVGREHAFIEYTGEEYTISDTCSKNGTSLNGILLEKGRTYPLHHGDQISLAHDNVICYFCLRNSSSGTLELPR